jgi:hypothetical protein
MLLTASDMLLRHAEHTARLVHCDVKWFGALSMTALT